MNNFQSLFWIPFHDLKLGPVPDVLEWNVRHPYLVKRLEIATFKFKVHHEFHELDQRGFLELLELLEDFLPFRLAVRLDLFSKKVRDGFQMTKHRLFGLGLVRKKEKFCGFPGQPHIM